jgi:dephospho-CoA kinase
MLLVCLTGGIGSGKTTVARLLGDRGATVFDADELAHRAIDPGTPANAKVVERFGPELRSADGSIDRQALARRVFEDERARRDLEAIVHPEVFRLLAEELNPYRETDRVVVFDAPLIVETGFHAACDVLVVVTAPADVRLARIDSSGRMTEEEAGARDATQAPDEDKERVADFVIRNDGSLEDLEAKVNRLWNELKSRARAGRSGSC